MEEETKLETPEEKAHRKERERFMRQAITQAKKAEKLMEVPIGCVIVYEGKVIARGYNRRNTDKNTLSHAELNAIRKASKKLGDWRLEGCTLYVTLEPCQMCAGAIVQARVSEVVIGSMNPKAGCAGSILNMLEMHEFNHQVKVDAAGDNAQMRARGRRPARPPRGAVSAGRRALRAGRGRLPRHR